MERHRHKLARSRMRSGWMCALLCASVAAGAQTDRGELRLSVTDASGQALRATVQIQSAANGYSRELSTNDAGTVDVRDLALGVYAVEIERDGFAPATATIAIRGEVPVAETVRLQVGAVHTRVDVNANTLLDPAAAAVPMQIGTQQIEQRLTSLPGRSIQDLVVSEPGWLYEGNAVLHPRGSEYQTQFVVDGIPLTDNRSPSFGPELQADDVQSMTVYTAGIPAEFGRKVGGVVEMETRPQNDPGTHGDLELFGGSYATAAASAHLQQVWRRNSVAISASGERTDHYLNPVVPENFTNRGTTGDFSADLSHDFSPSDRLRLSVRHEFSRYLIPNERIQEQAGQVQSAENVETMGTVHFEHIASPHALWAISGMVRDNADDLESNVHPTPIAAFQHNRFREGYFKAAYTFEHGSQDVKAGVESDNLLLHEGFRYSITNPEYFDSSTAPSLAFSGQRPDLEQAAFVEDRIHLRAWTLSAGLRWDHYQLLVNENGWSPRLSVGRYFRGPRVLLHASYDRVFITPSFENILLSSSAQASALGYPFLHLPVRPSTGNYYEGGLSKVVADHVRVDANVYRRNFRNFADDDQLLNTGVSYPISFSRAAIYGGEGKLTVDGLGRWSGFVSYSYMVGTVWLPVTGGLFLGDDAAAAGLSGHFPNTQDQRNTVNTRFRYQVQRRLWVAAGATYGSGLPFRYGGDEATALAQYGPAVVSRVDFERGRIRPNLSVNASLAATLVQRDRWHAQVQVDGENLTDRLNVIDFGGLFSGNAIAPARSVMARMSLRF